MHISKVAGIIMIVAGAMLLVLTVGILYFVLMPERQPGADGNIDSTNPFGNIGSGTFSSSSEGELELQLSDGSTVSVPDFTKDEQPVWVSEYEYQVTGDPLESYLVTFLEPDADNPRGEFLVTLLTEPLGETRRAVENALMRQLGISRMELCKLDADIAAGPGVNDAYPPDRNLGFSNCAGSVELP